MDHNRVTRREADSCSNMSELRQEIDALDRELVELLARRSRFIDRAVELKKIENLPARITDRVEQVISNVRSIAEENALDPELVERLWRELIEWAIQKESRHIPE